MVRRSASQPAAAAAEVPKNGRSADETRKRSYVSQTDVPSCTLDEALRVPQAIAENYAMTPTSPLRVAQALSLQPQARPFRMMCGAAIAYGLVSGGASADLIGVEPLAKRILRPTLEGDDMAARRDAFLRPRVFGAFLEKYNGNPLPRENIALNVLTEMGVPTERAAEVLRTLLDSAQTLGLVTEIKGKRYVDLNPAAGTVTNDPLSDYRTDDAEDEIPAVEPPAQAAPRGSAPDEARRRRVFVTHGKNKQFVEPVKKLLRFGELEAVLAVEHETVSVPVPDKVLSDMRGCGAAIIHVDAEMKLIDEKAVEHLVLNPNVLIEIGAAMALYGRRFILLVRQGISLPSNLQGLYEVRYNGDSLDGEATIKLLEAINDIKNHPLP